MHAKSAEVVCPEKRSAFANINLSRNTVADRVEDLSGNLGRQMNDKIKSFIAFSVAIDERTDGTDVAQLAILIRGVETLIITEEFLELVPVKDTTTANGIFSYLIRVLVKAEWTGHVLSVWLQMALHQWLEEGRCYKSLERKCRPRMEDKTFGHFVVFCIRKRWAANH